MLKNNINNLLLLIIALTLFGRSDSLACDSKCYSEEYIRQINNFHKTEVLPQLLEWKALLDNSMLDYDLALLNKCRADAKLIKQNIDYLMRQKIESSQNSEKNIRKEKVRDYFIQLKELAFGLQPLAEKYSNVISLIAAQMQVKSDEWKQLKNELCQSICIKNNSSKPFTGSNQMPSEKKCGNKLQVCNSNPFQSKYQCFNKQKIAFFMLWEGSDNLSEPANSNSNLAFNTVESLTDDSQLISNYPNPFSEITSVSFALSNAEHVKITISNQNGSIISTLFDGKLEPGEHSFDFDAKKLNINPGLYFYTIGSSSINHVGKMIYLGN